MTSLKATMEGFWYNLIDSDLIRGGVDLLQTLADGLVGLQETFGTTGLAVGTLTTAFGLFSPSVKKIAESFLAGEVSIDGYLAVLKNLYSSTVKTNGVMGATKTVTESLKTGFLNLANSAVVAQIKVIALQTVLSMGLGLAIGAVTSLLTNLCTSLFDTEGRMQSVEDASKSLSSTLENAKTSSVDIESYKTLQDKLKDVTLSSEERKKTEEELEDVKKRLYELDGNAYAMLNNQNLAYEEQYKWLKSINDEKVKEQAQALNDEMSKSSGFFGNDAQVQAEAELKKLEGYITNLKEIERLQAEAKGGDVTYGVFGTMNFEQQNEEIQKLKDNISKSVTSLQTYNSNVEMIKEANIDTSLSTVDLDDNTKKFVNTLTDSTSALQENTSAKEENAGIDINGNNSEDSNIEDLTKAYSDALTKMQDVHDLMEVLNEETAMTPELVSKAVALYPEVGANVSDIASLQQFLNEKIQEQEEIANQAYETMVLNDSNYYNNKLLQDEAWIENFRQSLINMGMSQQEAYDLDLKQFQTLNQLKTYAMNSLGEGVQKWLNQYIDTSADGYNIDFKNFKSYAEAKEAILKALNEEIKKVTANMKIMEGVASVAQDRVTLYAGTNRFDNQVLEDSKNKIEEYKNQLAGLNSAIQEVDSKIAGIGVSGISTGITLQNPISATSGSGSGSGSGSSSSGSNQSYKVDLEQWYTLKDAIEDVNNALELNRIKRERATGKDKINLMSEEISLLEKQVNLNQQLQKEMEKSKSELKKYITQMGGKFNGDNLVNYESLLGWTATTEQSIENLKALEEAVEQYTNLCNSEIPDVIQEWENLKDEIKKIREEQLEMVTSFEQDMYSAIEHYAKKENELRKKDLEAEKEAINEKKKLLEERKKILQESFDKEDREDAITEAEQTLSELDSQIQDALRSGDRELAKRLREQYAEQQKLLNEKIRDQERDTALKDLDEIGEGYDEEISNLDDLMDKLDEQLEAFLDPTNISKVIQSAMSSGIVDIMGNTTDLSEVMSGFLKETTIGVYSTKEALKELEDQLSNVGALVSQLPNISNALGLPEFSYNSSISRSVDLQTSQLVLQSPLVNVENLDSNSIGAFNDILNEKMEWLISTLNGKFNY